MQRMGLQNLAFSAPRMTCCAALGFSFVAGRVGLVLFIELKQSLSEALFLLPQAFKKGLFGGIKMRNGSFEGFHAFRGDKKRT